VKAVGLFRVKFHGPTGALIRVGELYLAEPEESDGTGLKEGRVWEQPAIFGAQFAEGGEELSTPAIFRLPPLPDSVIGWSVSVGIRAPVRWLPGSTGAWGDRIFVPRPDTDR
jgi:hypothetical protein